MEVLKRLGNYYELLKANGQIKLLVDNYGNRSKKAMLVVALGLSALVLIVGWNGPRKSGLKDIVKIGKTYEVSNTVMGGKARILNDLGDGWYRIEFRSSGYSGSEKTYTMNMNFKNLLTLEELKEGRR